MPDKDLRKQALKGGKTVSKKAAAKSTESTPYSSRPHSAKPSRTASKNPSRIASRNVSDDEDGYDSLSDDTNNSIYSTDQVTESDEFRETDTDLLADRLRQIVDQICERKGSSGESRESAFNSYNRMLISHHFGDVLYYTAGPLLDAFARSIKAETSPHETILALKAVSLTAISFSNSSVYEVMGKAVKRAISDSQDDICKAAAIHCLAACASFGGAAETEIKGICDYLLEIIESDGTYIGAEDNAEVVTAAIQEFTYLATEVQDYEDDSDAAIGALLDQLDSTDTSVQVAAGEAIALLYEKSGMPGGDDDSDIESAKDADADGLDENEEELFDIPDDEDHEDGPMPLRQRPHYEAYRDIYTLLEKVEELAKVSAKHLSKRDKQRLHKTFSSVARTIKRPKKGLMSAGSGNRVVRIHKTSEIIVDMWWKYIRLNFLRRQLGPGFVNHYYEGNSQVLNSLPVLMRDISKPSAASPYRNKPRKGDKYRNLR